MCSLRVIGTHTARQDTASHRHLLKRPARARGADTAPGSPDPSLSAQRWGSWRAGRPDGRSGFALLVSPALASAGSSHFPRQTCTEMQNGVTLSTPECYSRVNMLSVEKKKHHDAELNKGAELEISWLPELNLVSVLPELLFVLECSSP